MDSCAFDPKYSPEDQASLRLFELSENGELSLEIGHSTQKEVEHPNTPAWVKREANKLIRTDETLLTQDELNCKSTILGYSLEMEIQEKWLRTLNMFLRLANTVRIL